MLASLLSFAAIIAISSAKLSIEKSRVSDSQGDLYILAYSWTPEYCYGKQDFSGCENPEKYWNDHFTMHGLWPQYSTGGYPSFCTDEAFNSSAVASSIGWSTMTTYWPNVEYSVSDPEYPDFWDHEWTKHGTCTGLSQEGYFQAGIDLIQTVGTPARVTSAADAAIAAGQPEGSVSAEDLRADFGGPTFVSLQCESGRYISGAYTCWAQKDGAVVGQVVCPQDVQGEDSCSQSTLSVTVLLK